MLRISFYFFTQSANTNIHRAWSNVRSIAPNNVQYLISSRDATSVTHKMVQQSKLGCAHDMFLVSNGRVGVTIFCRTQ